MALYACERNNEKGCNYHRKEEHISEVARLLSDNYIGSLIVVLNRKVQGIVTERDILIALVKYEDNIGDIKVNDIMTDYVITISQNANISSAVELMESNKIKKLPVIDKNDNLVGMITASDIIINQHSTIKKLSKLISRK